jgi:hypothetical protein
MLRHIVLWKLDQAYSFKEREVIKEILKEKLLNLKKDIMVLRSIDVYFNSPEGPDDNYDIILDTLFGSKNDLNIYQAHQAHIKVVEYLKTIKKLRTAIDFEC